MAIKYIKEDTQYIKQLEAEGFFNEFIPSLLTTQKEIDEAIDSFLNSKVDDVIDIIAEFCFWLNLKKHPDIAEMVEAKMWKPVQ